MKATTWRRACAGGLVIAEVGCNGLLSNGDAFLEVDGAAIDGTVALTGAAGDSARSSSTTSSGGSGGVGGPSGENDGSASSGAMDALPGPAPQDRYSEPSNNASDATTDGSLNDGREGGIAPDASGDRREASIEASGVDVSAPRDVSNPVVCRESIGAPKIDPNTGISWNPVWYCANDRGAALFEGANSGAQIGYMTTIDSWFVCFRHGEVHRGGDDVWYYTQGDGTLPGWESRHAWGYMPSFYVRASTNPSPGIPECTSNP